jgi:hypothetical protein
MTTTGWTPTVGEFPFAPANGTVMSAFTGNAFDIRWDDPSTLNTGPATPSVRASVTVTVVGMPVTRSAATGTLTVAWAPVPVGANITIQGVTFYSVAGAPGANQFNGSSASATTVAANLAAAINASTLYSGGMVSAAASSGVVTLTARTEGAAGNSVTLGSATPTVVVSGGTLSGGSDGAYLLLATQYLYATTARTPGGMDFAVSASPYETAQSIAAAVNDKSNSVGFVTASAYGNVVTLYAAIDGSVGNGVMVETNDTTLTLSGSQTSGGYGVPCMGKSNSRWNIVGVNVYRSDTGERGPYFRVNKIPLGSGFFRDRTDVVLVENEVVDWSWGWVYKGDAPNLNLWRLRTHNRPLVKEAGDAVPANSPADVLVTVDGRMTPVTRVLGQSGEIDLDPDPVWNPATESYVYPPVPKPDGTSVVTVSYRYSRLNLVTALDANAKVFYRLTTVAVDPTGTSPSGLVETPLGYSEPLAALNSEKTDYIWTEAVRRNRWILEQGGERVKLFIRRVTGVPCPCQWDVAVFAFAKQPYNYCSCCYGTGFLGGYEGPIDIIVAPDESERRVTQTPMGRRLENTYEVWTGPRPMLSQRDFIVKQNGERFSVGPVRRTQVRGYTLQQAFSIGSFDERDIRYCVPLTGLENLPWPETRYTNPENAYEHPESPCAEGDPFPVGYDYQATPMGTNVPKVPEGRQLRGRTPVWSNIMFGGKGP